MSKIVEKSDLAFCGSELDRAGARRSDDAWLAAQRQAGRVLPMWNGQPLLQNDHLALLPWRSDWDGLTHILLGLDGTEALFAVDLTGETAPALDGGTFTEMRAAAFALPARESATAGQAKAVLDWHRRHGFCPNCGTATAPREAGYRRDCPHCGAQHFPRTDPVVIMLPVLGDHCLLGRNARFQNGLYSAFAGFIEPGETMEDAVRRELLEEAAVQVGAVRYHKSQPWPFPSSLMLGCYADALSRDFQIDGDEIADARWISRDEARARLAGGMDDDMRLPAPIAIAHHLLKDWVNKD